MVIRLLSVAILGLGALPSPAAPLPKDPAKGMPHLVWQIKPIDGIIGDIQHVHDKVKDVPNAPTWGSIEGLLNVFCPDWKKAVDLSKPLGGYLTIDPDIVKSCPIFLIPVKDSEAFKEMLSFQNPNLAEVPEKEGLYHGDHITFRFKDGYAHMGHSVGDLLDDPKKLPNPADLLLKDETALLAVRLYLEGAPEEAKKFVRDISKNWRGLYIGLPEMLLMGMIGVSDTKDDLVAKIRSVVDEGKWAALRFELDRTANTFSVEFNLVPKKDTALAKDIAAFQPKPSRFGGLLDEQTAAGALFGYGNFGGLKPDPKFANEMIKKGLEDIGLEGGDAARGLLTKALLNSIRVNEGDLAVALKKAPKAKTYTLVVGAKLNQPKLLAAATFGYLQTLPKEKRDCFKMNATTLEGDVAVHRLTLAGLPDEAKQLFGETDVYFCLKDEIMFAAMGTDAVDRLKECLKLQPQDGPQHLIEVNHAKLTDLVRVLDKDRVGHWKQMFPKEEKTKLLHGKLEGGSVLRIRYTTDVIPLIRMTSGFN